MSTNVDFQLSFILCIKDMMKKREVFFMINKQQNSMQRRAIAMLIDQAMSKVSKNREDALLKIVDIADWLSD